MAFRNIQAGMATYRGHGGDRGDAYYAHPTNAGPHPGVVVIHHMPGWDEWTCEVARKFAHHGYAAIAPSLYFRVGDGAEEAVVAKVREGGGIPDEQMLGDVTGAIDFLRSQPHASGKVGVIGFCSGGRQTYLVACKLSHLIQGAVDCWGGNVVVDDKSRLTKAQPVAPHDLTEGINCPLLGLFGNEDPNPSADQVNRNEAELKRLGCRVILFVDPDPTIVERVPGSGADGIEIYTGTYAGAFRAGNSAQELQACAATANITAMTDRPSSTMNPTARSTRSTSSCTRATAPRRRRASGSASPPTVRFAMTTSSTP